MTREEALEAALRKCLPLLGHAWYCASHEIGKGCDCGRHEQLDTEARAALAMPKDEARLLRVAEAVREACSHECSTKCEASCEHCIDMLDLEPIVAATKEGA